jgi:SAM-dependent methyltransferase
MTTAYDTVLYPNLCQVQTHPDRLAVVANLFGLDPAPPERCRVLEIGCGDGGNLLPLAAAFPDSRFVGFDLAQTRVQAGREAVASLGLGNLELVHSDILSFPEEGELFDYVIAHGIYSWIPDPAKDGLLRICQRRLAPQGVAYVSYNCLPGCHIRRMTREIMRFHTRSVQDPSERVKQAVAVCRFIANSIEKPDPYRQVFKEQLEQVERYRAGHLFHDDLAEINDPVYFHEFAAHAGRHGLQYLGEADFCEMQDDAFSEEARKILARMEDSRLTREQYLDFVKCRRFRQTLLVHAESPLRYPADAAAVERFHISSQSSGTAVGPGGGGPPVERFAPPRGGAIETSHPLAIHALHQLRDRWPATIPFAELFRSAFAAGAMPSHSEAEARRQLRLILLEAYRSAVVDFRRTPVACATRPSERPAASRLARWQLTRSPTVTTLRYENLRVEDETGKRLLLWLDGTRTCAELEQSLPDEAADAGGVCRTKHDHLARRLEELALLALLES